MRYHCLAATAFWGFRVFECEIVHEGQVEGLGLEIRYRKGAANALSMSQLLHCCRHINNSEVYDCLNRAHIVKCIEH